MRAVICVQFSSSGMPVLQHRLSGSVTLEGKIISGGRNTSEQNLRSAKTMLKGVSSEVVRTMLLICSVIMVCVQ